MPKHARCAELGVWKGDFSVRILELTEPNYLVLVDPWTFYPQYPERWYGGAVAKNQADMDEIYLNVQKRFQDEAAVRIERQRSDEFLSTTQSEFDWIYIDADHSEETVYRDLSLAWKRVVPDGFVTGDDYNWPYTGESFPVRNAVGRFCRERGCDVIVVGSQFIIKRI